MSDIHQDSYRVKMTRGATVDYDAVSGRISLGPTTEMQQAHYMSYMRTDVRVGRCPAQAVQGIREYANAMRELADRIEHDIERGWISKLSRKARRSMCKPCETYFGPIDI